MRRGQDQDDSGFDPAEIASVEAFQNSCVAVAGLSIHYLTAGQTGSSVVLLHGGGLDSASLSYRLTIGPLSVEHVVVAPDLPGYGKSDKPPVAYSLNYFVNFLGLFMEALGLQRVSLVGISMGGGSALGFALQSPEQVERLVLVDSYGLGTGMPGGAMSYLLVRLPWLNELSWLISTRSRSLLRWSLRSGIFGNPALVSEDLVDEVYRAARLPGAGRAFTSFQRNEATWGGLRTSYVDRLPDISMPTLIVHGARDRLVPVAYARRAHSLIPNSKLLILPECGHWPPREQPEEFNAALLRFLAGQ